ncbi:hypothetical protein BDQ17DRAFT_1436810 [Cyathus striatus]|nr:hypothetical protein BDQ17DRAFT_1436810 [Cyathus striatus]
MVTIVNVNAFHPLSYEPFGNPSRVMEIRRARVHVFREPFHLQYTPYAGLAIHAILTFCSSPTKRLIAFVRDRVSGFAGIGSVRFGSNQQHISCVDLSFLTPFAVRLESCSWPFYVYRRTSVGASWSRVGLATWERVGLKLNPCCPELPIYASPPHPAGIGETHTSSSSAFITLSYLLIRISRYNPVDVEQAFCLRCETRYI